VSVVLGIDEALEALAHGEVVALPTDTVYGLGASLAQPSAIGALFALKHRPASLALPVLVDSVGQIEQLGVVWPENARRLARAYWPGPLTIVVPVAQTLAALVGGTSDSVGFRIPDDELLRGLLARSGPLVVTSANSHGEAPCASAAAVLDAFTGHGELSGVLDGGPRDGVVSTVVDLSGPTWRVVREGAIRAEEITTALG
jgi:L-threonylcarbamoyladenylate synthase